MRKTILEKKGEQIKVLDETTRELLASMERKDVRRRYWASLAFAALLMVGILGIYRQNQIANNNKQHIDCIVKLFTQQNRQNKRITDINTCKISLSP